MHDQLEKDWSEAWGRYENAVLAQRGVEAARAEFDRLDAARDAYAEGAMLYYPELRDALVARLREEFGPDDATLAAALRLPTWTPVLEDLTDVEGDGETDAEMVTVALDYYGLA